jgi:hypothetical protein
MSTTFVVPQVSSPFRVLPYLSPTQYRNSPTAVGTQGLAPKSGNPTVDSTQVLADELNRCSGWMDNHVFRNPVGCFS